MWTEQEHATLARLGLAMLVERLAVNSPYYAPREVRHALRVCLRLVETVNVLQAGTQDDGWAFYDALAALDAAPGEDHVDR